MKWNWLNIQTNRQTNKQTNKQEVTRQTHARARTWQEALLERTANNISAVLLDRYVVDGTGADRKRHVDVSDSFLVAIVCNQQQQQHYQGSTGGYQHTHVDNVATKKMRRENIKKFMI